MKMDPTTESIAHFIGLFELAVEELRLRQEYLEFRLKPTTPDEVPPIEIVPVRLQAPHDVPPYDPGLSYQPQPPALPPVIPARIDPSAGLELLPPTDLPPSPLNDVEAISATVPQVVPEWSFTLEPPGSIASVTVQVATLFDDDQFLNGLGIDFTEPAVLHEMLAGIVGTADALSGFAVPDLPADNDWMALAQEVLSEISAAEPPAGPADAWVLRGEEATGVIVDGVATKEAPTWTDLLPLYLRPSDSAEAETAEEEPQHPADDGAATDGETVVSRIDEVGGSATREALPEHDFSRDFEGIADSPYALEPGHQIVAGANQAINEVAVASRWVDAPVIVVRGDVAKVDAISQVNVLVEHDTVDGVAAHQTSHAYNVADISEVSSEDPEAPPPDDVLPESWGVARVEADLIQVNWVKQYTFATDFDRAEVTFSGNGTFLGLGENQIVNSTILNEYGYTFDLISVAGNMVDATVVSQKNVLFDTDRISTAASVVAQDTDAAHARTAPSDDHAIEAVAEASGPLSEPSISADASVGDGMEETEEGPAAPPALSLADNLLLNQATLKTTGVDTFVEMTEAFAQAAEDLAQGMDTIAREVAQDALFAGKQFLRVLQVDGDLAKINLFEQTNIVGDADQIHLEMQNLRARLESDLEAMGEQLRAELSVVTGSNALVNLASTIENGIDSKIMAAGRVYDDAFIHQAELFDTDAVPTGVAVSALTNEAVAAFLSDNPAAAREFDDDIAPMSSYETSSQADVMQTALT